ncbi:hypothetical protein HBI56_212650 [Parastagonospora nodorum]|uniref:Uncharacterized protein n=1 Tax=Phaeosphaeria nodorum (strain SN15 / ATCC MYA-4574 / FGSC 10173) TaxID=321614 RepID=A0A7U2I848_PHANO|nr:hypothetical protein HBH56_229420 [Parastagonospora nodorum]QRD03663.1 hypothetical protein JI435_420050 [Parastagonospora nodorum SN15]KAH3921797.1 hypothetical protein HBH54_233330 [Parastagonospora nodorum]KAH3962979.1 hypothetical protein HBH51_170940 [Parastagonospora nodorum]KAH4013909.1 hypothetical protein HBI09_212710 [Parastagonospora nodorum]
MKLAGKLPCLIQPSSFYRTNLFIQVQNIIHNPSHPSPPSPTHLHTVNPYINFILLPLALFHRCKHIGRFWEPSQ